MSGDRIFVAIRKICLRHIILPSIVSIIAVMIYYLFPFRDVFTPKLVGSGSEAVEYSKKGHKYASINVNNLYYTGFDIKSGDKIAASYYYEMEDNKCTFYLLDDEYAKNQPKVISKINLKVRFVEKDGLYENMLSGFAGQLNWTTDGINKASNSLIMSQADYHLYRYVALYIIIFFLFIYGFAMVVFNLIFLLLPKIHPAMLKFYASMDRDINESISTLMDSLENHMEYSVGDMHITDKYFVNIGKAEVSIMKLDNILQGYEHAHLKVILGFHIKMTSTLYLQGYEHGKIAASKKDTTDVATVIEYLKEKNPDIIWGHSKENNKLAKARKEARKKERSVS